ncbi:MAG: hypothetical protein ACK574_02120 [Bacteroidota bacterium]
MSKFDKLYIGIITGILAPLAGVVIFYAINFSGEPMLEFLTASIKNKLLSPLLSLCAVINLGLFYLYLQFNYLYSARGVILSTLLLGLAIVVVKFVI